MHADDLDFEEPVVVTKGPNKGRIGVYDDTEFRHGREVAVVKFGSPLVTPGFQYIQLSNIARPDTSQLLSRLNHLLAVVNAYVAPPSPAEHIELLQEYYLIDSILSGRYEQAKLARVEDGIVVFLSHSSKDKWFVNRLAVDLTYLGHKVWLDEWEIRIGDSIPKKISAGIESADFVAVALSEHAVTSRWVEVEWQAKYWDEIQCNRTQVLPLLIEPCEVPTLLRNRKYADFSSNYSAALKSLAQALHAPKGDG